MATEVTTLRSYENINKIDFGEKVIFLKFGAEWCKPCNKLEKNMECIPDVILYNISIDNTEFEDLVESKGIDSIPYTEVKYHKNKMTFTGIKTVQQLTEIISTIKA